MADNVKIGFSADITELRQGLAEAQNGVASTTTALQASVAQINASFASMGQAYAAGMAQRLNSARSYSSDELAVARSGDKAQTDIALNGVKLKESAAREQAQLSRMSRQDELSTLLSLENERQQIQLAHLTFLRSTYKDNVTEFANVQREIDELASQSALRRQQIEQRVANEINGEYRRSFQQVGSSVTSGIMGMIKGHETFRQAVSNVLLSIIQSFIQARIQSVANWASGMAAEVAMTSASEAAKTSAVVGGSATRTSAQIAASATTSATTLVAISRSIVASAAETFAGVFGFLAPILGPAAAAPAAAAQGAVLGQLGGIYDTGAWSVPNDMIAAVHAGEMIVPSRGGIADEFRSFVDGSGKPSGGDTHVHFNVSAIDSGSVKSFFSNNSRHIMSAINQGLKNGDHTGFRRFAGA